MTNPVPDPSVVSRRNVMAGLGIFGAGFAALTSKAWAQAMPTGSASNEAVARPTGPSGPYLKISAAK